MSQSLGLTEPKKVVVNLLENLDRQVFSHRQLVNFRFRNEYSVLLLQRFSRPFHEVLQLMLQREME